MSVLTHYVVLMVIVTTPAFVRPDGQGRPVQQMQLINVVPTLVSVLTHYVVLMVIVTTHVSANLATVESNAKATSAHYKVTAIMVAPAAPPAPTPTTGALAHLLGHPTISVVSWSADVCKLSSNMQEG